MNLFNLEAEKFILGCLMANEASDEISETVFYKLNQNDFYSESNQLIFACMLNIFAKGIKIDFAVVCTTLETKGLLARVGDIEYLIDIAKGVFSTVNFSYHLGIVENFSKLRKIEKFGHYIQEQTKSGKNGDELLNEAEICLSKLAMLGEKNDLEPISNSIEQEYERIIKASNGEYEAFGVRTGFKNFDNCIWGLRKGHLLILAGRPGGGKTDFALNVLYNAAIKENKKCAFFSLEMDKSSIARRLLSIGSIIDDRNLLNGEGVKEKLFEIDKAKQALNQNNIYIDHTTNLTPQQILTKCKKMKRQKGLDLLIIDYLQKIRPPRSLNNSVTEIGETARAVKDIARQLEIPILCLCQPNRQQEVRNKNNKNDDKIKEVYMSDLRGSGEIEQEADLVAFLRTNDEPEKETKTIFLQIVKNRHGKMINFKFEHVGKIHTFRELGSNAKQIGKMVEIQDEMPFDNQGVKYGVN